MVLGVCKFFFCLRVCKQEMVENHWKDSVQQFSTNYFSKFIILKTYFILLFNFLKFKLATFVKLFNLFHTLPFCNRTFMILYITFSSFFKEYFLKNLECVLVLFKLWHTEAFLNLSRDMVLTVLFWSFKYWCWHFIPCVSRIVAFIVILIW